MPLSKVSEIRNIGGKGIGRCDKIALFDSFEMILKGRVYLIRETIKIIKLGNFVRMRVDRIRP